MPTVPDAQIAGLAKAAGFPADQIATAVAVALAESGGNSSALNTRNSNGSWDAGLWQINSIHGYSQSALMNPTTNAAAAYKVWSAARSWSPWSVYKSGAYRVYLARGAIAATRPTGGGTGTPDVGLVTDPPFNPTDPLNPFSLFSDTGMWVRVGLVLLGGFLVLLGLAKLAGIGSIVAKVAKR